MNTKPYPWGATALALCALGASSLSSATEVRFASFNASLNRGELGQLLDDLSNPGGAGFGDTTARRIQQAHNVAEIIQRTRPDVLLVNEFDFDDAGVPGSSSTMKPLGYSSEAARLFQNNFLSAGHGGPLHTDHQHRHSLWVRPRQLGLCGGRQRCLWLWQLCRPIRHDDLLEIRNHRCAHVPELLVERHAQQFADQRPVCRCQQSGELLFPGRNRCAASVFQNAR